MDPIGKNQTLPAYRTGQLAVARDSTVHGPSCSMVASYRVIMWCFFFLGGGPIQQRLIIGDGFQNKKAMAK